MLEDFYLMMKVYYYANSVEYVPKCLYNYNRTNQSSIIATFFPKIRFPSNPSHSSKARLPIFSTLFGITRFPVKLWQQRKALYPIVVTPSSITSFFKISENQKFKTSENFGC